MSKIADGVVAACHGVGDSHILPVVKALTSLGESDALTLFIKVAGGLLEVVQSRLLLGLGERVGGSLLEPLKGLHGVFKILDLETLVHAVSYFKLGGVLFVVTSCSHVSTGHHTAGYTETCAGDQSR